MAESPNPDWMNQWQDLSRNYMAAWQGAARNASGAATAAAPAWPPGFEQWSRLFAGGGVGGAQSGTIERMIDTAKGYAAFMQSIIAATGTGNASGTMPAWGDILKPAFGLPTGFGVPGMDGSAFENPMFRALRDLQAQAGLAANPFEGMMNSFAAMQPPAAAAFGDVGDLKAWLSLPAFGEKREQQEHYQAMAVAGIDVQQQMQRYSAQMMKATQRGFQLYQGKLSEREQPGRQIDSLRALYDVWVDAAEEGYAEVALSAEFRDVYGAMVNAQMRLRALVQKDAERIAGEFGMPTRSEVNSIGERLQALRREVRAAGAGNNAELARDVAALRRELASLKSGLKSVAPERVASRKRPAAVAEAVAAPAKKRVAARAEPVAAQPRTSKAKTKRSSVRKAATKPARAVAATAPSTFASRIAKFADASVGNGKSHRLKKKAKAEKSGKKR